MSGEQAVRAEIYRRLSSVVDPCMEAAGLGLSLVDLGIVRDVTVDDGEIAVELGLTEPGCGFTHALVTRVEDALEPMGADRRIAVRFNWREPWTEAMMTDDGRRVFEQARERGVSVLRRFDIDAVRGAR